MAEFAPPTRRAAPDGITAQRLERKKVAKDGGALNHSPRVKALNATAQLINARPMLAAQRATGDKLNARSGTPSAVTQRVKRNGQRAPVTLSPAFTDRHVATTNAKRETAFNTRLAANHNLVTNTTATATAWKTAINAAPDQVPANDVNVTVRGVDTTKAAAVFNHSALGDLNKTVALVTNGAQGAKATHVGG
jgi:hypothetical protein